MTEREASADTERPRKRLSLWILALAGALGAALYAVLVEKMHFGPPFVMFALGGMTLALAGAALMRVIDPLTSGAGTGGSGTARKGRRTRELEREKQLVLKAIKEVELDYQMRKIAERDYREMVERYRTRALRLMSEIEAGEDFRSLIEKELAMRLKLDAVKLAPGQTADILGESSPSPAAAVNSTSSGEDTRKVLVNPKAGEERLLHQHLETVERSPHAERSSCASCGTLNDEDARFCKKCGAKLASS